MHSYKFAAILALASVAVANPVPSISLPDIPISSLPIPTSISISIPIPLATPTGAAKENSEAAPALSLPLPLPSGPIASILSSILGELPIPTIPGLPLAAPTGAPADVKEDAEAAPALSLPIPLPSGPIASIISSILGELPIPTIPGLPLAAPTGAPADVKEDAEAAPALSLPIPLPSGPIASILSSILGELPLPTIPGLPLAAPTGAPADVKENAEAAPALSLPLPLPSGPIASILSSILGELPVPTAPPSPTGPTGGDPIASILSSILGELPLPSIPGLPLATPAPESK